VTPTLAAVHADLHAAREATSRLLATVDGLSADDLAGASLLPGWTRAHVLAHLAGNARSHVRMLSGVQRGEVADQYADGAAGRAQQIADLAADPPAAVAAVRASADELERCWRRTSEQHWDGLVRPLDGGPEPASRLAWSRRREVEVHHVDLDAGYRPADWPAAFVERLLAELLRRDDLPPLDGIGGPPADLAAWLSGRSQGEGLTGALPDLPQWC
jgi:maleylpyruvate isomerase